MQSDVALQGLVQSCRGRHPSTLCFATTDSPPKRRVQVSSAMLFCQRLRVCFVSCRAPIECLAASTTLALAVASLWPPGLACVSMLTISSCAHSLLPCCSKCHKRTYSHNCPSGQGFTNSAVCAAIPQDGLVPAGQARHNDCHSDPVWGGMCVCA